MGRRKIDEEVAGITDEEAKNILIAFEENMKKANLLREAYEGKFIAVFNKEVVGDAPDYKSLLKKIPEYFRKPETYIGYISRKTEVLLI